ncbi:hypothetical protein WJX72_005243 [[Myrmecia] bisecta]|uniref:AAA+ ATPase domain-containing protein n=1 Tax=[Myrmecia] bisecta TaxID=41462 RepID=A0AAW1R7M1_9CHLO
MQHPALAYHPPSGLPLSVPALKFWTIRLARQPAALLVVLRTTSGTSSVIDRPPFTAFGPFGTRIGAFRKVQMEENPILSTGSPKVFLFNTLTAMPEYHAKSLDELRWEDYQAGFPAGLGTLALLAPQPGTRMVSFRKVQDPDYATLQSGRDVLLDFATITAMPEYQNTSLEELRWGDYQAGVKGSETAQQPTPWQTGSSPSFTAMPEYHAKSLEELRWEDYQGVHRVLEYACLHCLAAPLDLMLHYLPRHIFTDGGPVVDLTACLYCEPSPAGESNLRCDHSRNETARVLLSHGWHLHEDVTQQDSTAARPGGMNAAPTTQTPGKTTPEMEYFAAVQQQLGPAWWRHAASDLPPPLKPIVRLPLSRIGRAPAAQQAVTLITAHSMLSRPGPLVLAFSGPPGHGKTDMAWELARLMQEVPLSQADFLKVSCAAVRTADDLLRFNSQLNHFVAEHDGKHGVVLLAGFDKLEPQGQLGFLEAFDTGSWTASGAELQTATVDCSKLIFILTAVQAEPNAVLLSPESQKLGLPFAQEVIGRIADVVPFPAYTRKEKLLLVQHYLNKECRKWRTGAGLAAGQCAVEIAYDVGVVKGLLGRCCRLVDVTGVPEIALRVQFEVAQALVRQRLEAFGVSGQAGRLSDCA